METETTAEKVKPLEQHEEETVKDQVKTPESSPRVGGKKVKRGSRENNDLLKIQHASADSNEENLLDEKEIHFFPPAEGTPAAQALQGMSGMRICRKMLIVDSDEWHSLYYLIPL